MKLGIETYHLREKLGDIPGLEAVAEAGFDCVDYSFFDAGKHPEFLGSDYEAHGARIGRKLKELGLTCCQTHAPYDFTFCNEMNAGDPEFQKILRAMEASGAMGTPYIVVHPVLAPVYVDMPEYNLRFFKSLEPYCERFGIQIAIENIYDRDPAGRCMGRFGTPERMGNLLDRLDSPWFCMCLDTGHSTITGTKPEDFIRAMGNRLRVLHVQDTELLDDDHMLPYLGAQEWSPVLQALAETKFSGALSFEVPGLFRRLSPELLLPALRFAEAVGRHMIREFEAAQI